MDMTGFGIGFFLLTSVLLLLLPRKWASLPLLLGACYMTLAQGVTIGPFHFNVVRMIMAVGVVRVIIRGERLAGRMNELDWLMLVWACWLLISSIFHNDPSGALVFRLGVTYNLCGIYFLFRVFCQSPDDVIWLCRLTAILLIPVAVEMVCEKLLHYNFFSVLGGVPLIPDIREGHSRAQGPFAHAILAGTVGSVCVPLMLALWYQHRKLAIVGLTACIIMVLACSSSGPIMSFLAAVGALFMWKYRHKLPLLRRLAVLGYLVLLLVMKAPPYYIMSHIDAVGGSTGWHRARLIESAIEHLNEWWLGGTDYTRHWMASGVTWSPDHCDITNYYIAMGVFGGLLSILLFIAVLTKGFSYVGRMIRQSSDFPLETQSMVWVIGSALFAHTVACIAVYYFDQSYVFLYLTLALIGSAWSSSATRFSGDPLRT